MPSTLKHQKQLGEELEEEKSSAEQEVMSAVVCSFTLYRMTCKKWRTYLWCLTSGQGHVFLKGILMGLVKFCIFAHKKVDYFSTST